MNSLSFPIPTRSLSELSLFLYLPPMKATASLLLQLINQHLSALNNISEEDYAAKPAPNKWSKKEILGHLIDSAQSNIRRFVIAQYEENPFIK